jgi:hypothetical protein
LFFGFLKFARIGFKSAVGMFQGETLPLAKYPCISHRQTRTFAAMLNLENFLRCRPLRKMCWLLLTCCTLATLTGCATTPNSYTQYYQDKAGPDITNLAPYSGSTQILASSNTVNDAKDLYRNGYTLLGVSEFQDQLLSESALMFQAKQVGADVVLCSRVYLRTGPPALVPSDTREETMVTPSGLPITVRLYQYQAGFFRKGPPGILGVMYRPIPSEIRQKLARNTGVFVHIVRTGSPASDAKILEGDVILKMNGEDVTSEADLGEKLNKLAGQKVDLEIWRDGQSKTISVQLNNKP